VAAFLVVVNLNQNQRSISECSSLYDSLLTKSLIKGTPNKLQTKKKRQ